MVVYDPGDLHEGVDCRRADALEASPHQVLAHGFRFGRLGGYSASVEEAVCNGPVVHEAPAVVAERSEFLNYLQKCVDVSNTPPEVQKLWNSRLLVRSLSRSR